MFKKVLFAAAVMVLSVNSGLAMERGETRIGLDKKDKSCQKEETQIIKLKLHHAAKGAVYGSAGCVVGGGVAGGMLALFAHFGLVGAAVLPASGIAVPVGCAALTSSAIGGAVYNCKNSVFKKNELVVDQNKAQANKKKIIKATAVLGAATVGGLAAYHYCKQQNR